MAEYSPVQKVEVLSQEDQKERVGSELEVTDVPEQVLILNGSAWVL